jgi:cobalt-zinc-cadmium efflux system outer membrane protein
MMLVAELAVAGELLTYEATLQRAAERAVGAQTAAADVDSAEGVLLAARAAFEPQLSLGGSYFSSANEGQFQFGEYTSNTTGLNASAGMAGFAATGTSWSLDFDVNQSDTSFKVKDLDQEFGDPAWQSKLALSVSQALLEGHRMTWNLRAVRSAASELSAAELAKDAARQQAMADAATAYWTLHYQRRLVEIGAASLEASTEQARVVRALVEAGKLAPVEGTRTDAALAQAERALLEARAAAALADDALQSLLGLPLAEEVELGSVPPLPPDAAVDAEGVVDVVREGNRELRIARNAVEAAELAAKDARLALLPELGASGSIALRGYEADFSGALSEMAAAKLPEWSAGLSLSLPLLNRADRGAAGMAEAALARARLQLSALEASTEQSARAQVRTLDAARRNVELAELNVRLAGETLSAETARLTEGRSLQKDVIAARRELDQARADAEKARTDWVIARVELERLEGAL